MDVVCKKFLDIDFPIAMSDKPLEKEKRKFFFSVSFPPSPHTKNITKNNVEKIWGEAHVAQNFFPFF